MTGPLQGIRAVEFTEIIAGPVAGMLLSDLGADVIKVEPPWGDPWRRHMEIADAESRAFISLNRGKRSIALDLKNPRGAEVARRLADTADVVLANYRPDVPERLGIDYDALAARNPRLVYCEATAFGRAGPDSARPGYDLIVQAMTGVMAAEGIMEDGRPRAITSSAIADFATGYSMVAAICAALYHRALTGVGQKIEATLLANALTLQAMPLTRVEAAPSAAQEWVDRDLPLLREAGAPFADLEALYQERRVTELYRVYYRTYRTADWVIAVGCLSAPLRKRLMEVLGLRDIRFDPGCDPESEEALDFGEKLIGQVEEIFAGKTTAEWLKVLTAAGVPCGPVRFVESMLEDEQALANGMIVEQSHARLGRVRTVGPLTRMSRTPPEAGRPSPALGEHTAAILAELGYAAAEIEEIGASGALG